MHVEIKKVSIDILSYLMSWKHRKWYPTTVGTPPDLAAYGIYRPAKRIIVSIC